MGNLKAIPIKTRDSLGKIPFRKYIPIEVKHVYNIGKHRYLGFKVRGSTEFRYFDPGAFLLYGKEELHLNEHNYDRLNELLKTLKNGLLNENYSLLDQVHLVIAMSNSLQNILREMK